MRLIYDEEDRSELADLGNIQIPTEDGRPAYGGSGDHAGLLK